MNNLIDLHTHSVLSTHAFSSLTENISSAQAKGLKYYGISEHQYDDKGVGAHQYSFHNLRIVPKFFGEMRFLRGCEFNILRNGTIDTSKLKDKYLDYGIASMHSYKYNDQGIEENTNCYLKVLDDPFVTILGHIDDGHYPAHYEPIIKKTKELHKLIEINNTSLKPTTNRINSKENLIEIINLCKKYQQPVIINSDAHICYDIGQYELAYNLLKELDFPMDLVLNFNENLIAEYIDLSKL